MNKKTATAILKVAVKGGYLEEMPDADEIVKQAEFYYEHAKDAIGTENSDKTIEKIVEIGKDPKQGLSEEKEEEPAAAKVTKEGLPIPPQIEGDPPVMPMDTSELTSKEVRRLMGEFNACLGRVIWLLQGALDEELRLKQLKEDSYRRAYLAEESAARENSVKLTKEALDYAARESEEYQDLSEKLFEAGKVVRNYKALKEIYGGNIDRLSREATIRDDEHKRNA